MRATAFVDWDVARRIIPVNTQSGRKALVSRAVSALQEALADILKAESSETAFRVAMRFYHGWHRGKTATDDRREFDFFVSGQSNQRRIDRVSFEPDIAFGDELLCASRRGRLFDTLRTRQDGRAEQKMVDTAIVADLLHCARGRDGALLIVVGDDDDLLPGAFTAEAWGARVLIARLLREADNPHLDTCGIIKRR